MDNSSIIRMVESKIEKAVADFNMEGMLNGVLVAYSGGADSSALLFYLHKYCTARGIGLWAVHVNHCIRGEEADRDERFCIDTCARLGIPLFTEREDVPAFAASSGRSIEEAARIVRYRAYNKIVREHPGINFIATAHNSEDNMETVFFNMIRGTGLRGLCGIPPVRGCNVIRPLIYCTKSEIIGYCIARNIEYVTDSTNASTDYTRNYIRQEIIPKLSRINPQPEIAISRLCALLRADESYIHRTVHRVMEEHKIETAVSRELLASLDPSIQSRVVMHMHANTVSDSFLHRMDYEHVQAVLALSAPGAPANQRLSLPGRICAYVSRTELMFMPEDEVSALFEKTEAYHYSLQMGENRFTLPDGTEWCCRLSVKDGGDFSEESEKDENIYKLSIYARLSFDKIKGDLFIRNRRQGDRYHQGGMRRQLRKMLSEAGIPIAKRDALPLLCEAGEPEKILWVPGFEVGDEAAYRGEGKCLHITFTQL